MEFIVTFYTHPKDVSFGNFSKSDLLSDLYTTLSEFKQWAEFLNLAFVLSHSLILQALLCILIHYLRKSY